MEIKDIRRVRLAKLIDERYDGSQAKFIDETGESQSEVSGLLREKSFGERKARKIEAKCNLPAGWLDRLDSPAPAPTKEKPPSGRPELTVVSSIESQWMGLVYVTQAELDLLSNYRSATELGKSMIETAAESATSGSSGTGTAHKS